MKQNIEDYAILYPGVLSKQVCEQTLKELEKITWEEHHFYSVRSGQGYSPSPGQEFLTSHTKDISTHPIIMKNIWRTIHTYIKKDMQFPWFPGWEGYTSVRWNRYSHNTKMQEHCDFIHSIFDGDRKGIPTLSIVGALNEEYTGGEFIMYRDKEIKLKTGDLLVFPSTFMYPHRVDPVKKGARYSFVSWVY